MGCQQSQPKADRPDAITNDKDKKHPVIRTNISFSDYQAMNDEPISPTSFFARSMKSREDLMVGNVVLRVIKAELTKNFDTMTKMDPFAIVYWMADDGSRKEASRTRTDWSGHMTPTWNHTCRAQEFCAGDIVEIQVWEKDVILSEFCGKASMPVEKLLGEAFEKSDSDAIKKTSSSGFVLNLPLKLDSGETTGSVAVQAIYIPKGEELPTIAPTSVDAALFEAPVKRLGVSGGTAPFFELILKSPSKGQNPTYYIGKDLSHASDEVDFYEQVLAERKREGSELAPLLKFFFEYAGVVKTEIDPTGCKAKDTNTKELLVMQNLRDNHSTLRMLDIKIGQVTSQAGWQGKSRMASIRQSIVDGLTNSAAEGFRLEGFDNRPPALASMDPLLDIGGQSGRKEKTVKKATRIMLQRLPASEILMHFLDVHQEPAELTEAQLASTLAPIEVVQIVLAEVVERLSGLSVACRKCPVPQKWIGSSVALAFESGKLPARSREGIAETQKNTHINVFDWGRSELNTLSRHTGQLTDDEQRDRSKFWSYYVGGIDRLAWEATRAYWHLFNNTGEWDTVTFGVFDFDSMTRNEFIGKCTVPVEETPETEVKLSGDSSLWYSISWRSLPEGSRLKGTWRIKVHRAEKVPGRDGPFKNSSDPFCEVVAVSKCEQFRCRQITSVKVLEQNPVWDEIFDLPVAAKGQELEAALNRAAHGLGNSPTLPALKELMLSFNTETSTAEATCEKWAVRLDNMLTAMEAKNSAVERTRTRDGMEYSPSSVVQGSPHGSTGSGMLSPLTFQGSTLVPEESCVSHLPMQQDNNIAEVPPTQPVCCTWLV